MRNETFYAVEWRPSLYEDEWAFVNAVSRNVVLKCKTLEEAKRLVRLKEDYDKANVMQSVYRIVKITKEVVE